MQESYYVPTGCNEGICDCETYKLHYIERTKRKNRKSVFFLFFRYIAHSEHDSILFQICRRAIYISNMRFIDSQQPENIGGHDRDVFFLSQERDRDVSWRQLAQETQLSISLRQTNYFSEICYLLITFFKLDNKLLITLFN